jgi:hypothetical protein
MKRVLEKIAVAQQVKKFPASRGIRRFITMFTSVRQQKPVYSLKPYLITVYFNIVFPSTPRSTKWSLPFMFSNWNVVFISILPMLATFPAHLTPLKIKLFCEQTVAIG